MASRQMNRLTALGIGKLVDPGYYADGGGLYLQISASGSRSWIYRFSLAGRAREMGLGSLSVLPLAAARKVAADCRASVKHGIDPIAARRRAQVMRAAEGAPGVTFRQAAEAFIADRASGWRNTKHAKQWTSTLEAYAYPVIGDIDVRDIDTEMIVRILQPIWMKKGETARRVRGRVKAILDAETVLGHRTGDNPARYVDHLDRVLPRVKKRNSVKHHPALSWEEMPAFFAALRQRPKRAAQALRLLILTATRTNEVLFARPEEFDLDARVWTIPGDRMKAEQELRVPLCDEAVELVRMQIATKAKWGWLFPGYKEGRPLSNMAMLLLLRRMGRGDITVHGFRSTFRDWIADCTDYPDSLAEQALAHTISSTTVSAYRRRDMLERRRGMMEDWARYCAGQTATVVPFTHPAAQTAA
ncbi:tyrosine-type recombinase/integrase [Burkholderia pseudomallei]|uniref:tyrosine-type recombinase/integrase n=1 Tax=Burkholderia pseudomallei TaxID=28450 RepID=UPI000538B442|nr:site-specific integrase [Burkholderia pseudomallei]KGU90714.1 phage integrase [Burkholderia pseudomallei MSHR4032]ONC97002.1 integrase [Burkholderia pseudomallei]OND02626.1 integrase [Burkholderia pseudomallei]OND02762.1 integrase [Burkholderia pseudomallei]OND12399.1 integrase [Burkholderia pseudomallei]